MSSEKELVFVAGHKAIYGDKLRYYLYPWLLNRTKIQHPAISDTVTQIHTYDELRAVQAAERESKKKDREMVVAAMAAKEGMTLAEYLKKQEEDKQHREEEILANVQKALGKEPQKPQESAPAPAHGARNARPQAQEIEPDKKAALRGLWAARRKKQEEAEAAEKAEREGKPLDLTKADEPMEPFHNPHPEEPSDLPTDSDATEIEEPPAEPEEPAEGEAPAEPEEEGDSILGILNQSKKAS